MTPSETEELKPCPFCGSSLLVVGSEAFHDGEDIGCPIWKNVFRSTAWNTRPIEAALKEEIEKLKGDFYCALTVTKARKALKRAEELFFGLNVMLTQSVCQHYTKEQIAEGALKAQAEMKEALAEIGE